MAVYELDDLFVKEFKSMMTQLKHRNGNLDLNALPLSHDLSTCCTVSNNPLVVLRGIEDEYYSRLNNQVGILWVRPNLKRRKYGSDGNYIKKNGNFVIEDVSLPQDCIAYVSDFSIGVKTKYKPKEDFSFVDVVSHSVNGVKSDKYVYIIPKKYAYKVNQTALVLSTNKLTRSFYSGVSLATIYGSYLFMFIIDYKPSSSHKNYRIMATGTHPDELSKLGNDLINYYIEQGVVFNPSECEVLNATNSKVDNLAKEVFPGVLDLYTMFSEKSMINDTNLDYQFMEEE